MLKAKPTDRPPIIKGGTNKKDISRKIFSFNKFFYSGRLPRIALFIFAVFIIGAFIAPMFMNLKVWKPEIILLLEELTNKKAYIDGDIQLNIFPMPEVTINEIKLQDKESKNDQYFLSLNEIRAKIKLGSLIKGNIVIEKVNINGFELFLNDHINSQPNWVINNNNSNKDLNNLSNTDADTDDNITLNFESDKVVSFADIEIEDYEFSDGIIYFENNKYSLSIGIDEIIVSPYDSLNNFVSGNLNIYGEEISLSSNFLKNDENSLDSIISLKHENLSINIDAVISFIESYPRIVGEIEIASQNINDFLKTTKVKAPSNIDLNIPLKTNAKIKFFYEEKNLGYEIENLVLSLGKTNFSGAVNGKNGEEPNIKIILSSNSIDLDNAGIHFPNKFLTIENKKNKNMEVKPKENEYWEKIDASILLTADTAKLYDHLIRDLTIDINRSYDKIFINQFSSILPGNTKIKVMGSFESGLNIFKGKVAFDTEDFRSYAKWLDIENVNYFPKNKIRLVKFNSDIVVRPGASTFAGMSGRFDNTNFSGEMRIRLNENENSSALLKFDKINIDSYLSKNEILNEEKSNIKNDPISFKKFFNSNAKIDLNVVVDDAIYFKNKIRGLEYVGSVYDDKIIIDTLLVKNLEGISFKAEGAVDIAKTSPVYNLDIELFSKSKDLYNFYEFPENLKDILVGDFRSIINIKGHKSSLESNIEADFSNLSIYYEGNINLEIFSSPTLDGDLVINHTKIEKILNKKLGVNYSLFKGNGVFRSKVFIDEKTFSFNDIVFKTNELKYTGNTKIVFGENVLNFDTDISGNKIVLSDLYSFLNLVNFSNSNKRNGTKISGKIALDFEDFRYYTLDLNSVRLISKISPNILEIKKFDGKIYGGTFSIKSKIEKNKDYITNTNLSFSHLNINSIDNNFLNWNSLNGNASGVINLESKTKNLEEIPKKLHGNAKLNFNNVFINGFNPNNLVNISSSLNSQELDQIIKNLYGENLSTNLKSFSTEVIFENSSASFNEIIIDFTKIKSNFSGTFNFVNQSTESYLDFNLMEGVGMQIGLIYSGEWDKIKKSSIIKRQKLDNLIVEEDKNIIQQSEISEISDDNETSEIEIKKENFSSDVNLANDREIKNYDAEENNKALINMNLPKLAKVKQVSSPDYEFYKESLISEVNNIVKPQKPSQEDLLDNVLDSILE